MDESIKAKLNEITELLKNQENAKDSPTSRDPSPGNEVAEDVMEVDDSLVREDSEAPPAWFTHLVVLYGVLALCLSAAIASLYFSYQNRPVRYVTLDLESVVEHEKLYLQSMVTSKPGDDGAKMASYARLSSLNTRIDAGVETIRKRCECIILLKNAVVSKIDADVTDELRQLIGLDRPMSELKATILNDITPDTSVLDEMKQKALEARKNRGNGAPSAEPQP
jgi:hypothetical protein